MGQNIKRIRRAPVAGQKVNVGVLIDSELWQRFKIRCLEEGRGEGELLSQLIDDYLKKGS